MSWCPGWPWLSCSGAVRDAHLADRCEVLEGHTLINIIIFNIISPADYHHFSTAPQWGLSLPQNQGFAELTLSWSVSEKTKRAGLSLTSPSWAFRTPCPIPSFPRRGDISAGAVSVQENSVIDLNKSRALSTLGVLLPLLLCAPAQAQHCSPSRPNTQIYSLLTHLKS